MVINIKRQRFNLWNLNIFVFPKGVRLMGLEGCSKLNVSTATFQVEKIN